MKNQTPQQIVKKLVADFRARKGVFQNRINVEDWAPKRLEFDRAFWIWGVYN